ncbi:hypothetical protein PFICI_04785 [Pestalotiopsis fici W106-1]|uniref:Abscisic acid ABA receptor n=1 Tax=Pestalotiopsis fici (strain W106-1 / CGMCC3.15140) TaxID=1229662 RepID=W3XA52_PESFW|nr:uncharacterized protein PFICI_04785 [Pestalotiopsis fici W106-1]ETS82909.1 hypothetical protein PFICI_04785 [Pestalotiopsis fici W106-1]
MAHHTAHHHRYFANPEELLTNFEEHKELLASLDRINVFNPPVHTCSTGWEFHGLYTGPTSVAYLFYRLSSVYPGLDLKDQSLLDWAKEYLDLGSRVDHKSPTPSHCGIANEILARLALSAAIEQETSFVEELCAYEPIINSSKDDGSNEWLYGRAGWLYLLRLCRAAFQQSGTKAETTLKLLNKTIDKTVSRILRVPQPWTWHGSQYLGAAHGTLSVITQVVLSRPTTAPPLQLLLSRVLDRQFESGNFPSSVPGSGHDRLVQFCHGGPGFVLSLRSLLPYFSGSLGDKMRLAIARAQFDVRERGVLRKEPCLCHGVAGNALALDDDESFRVFLSCMATNSMKKLGWMKEKTRNEESASLYTGEAGRAWVWAVAEMNLPRTCIGYNDL